jgi:hypothetical protein
MARPPSGGNHSGSHARTLLPYGGPARHQRIPALAALLAPLTPAVRPEVVRPCCSMTGAGIAWVGRRTLSRVGETTGQTRPRHHAAAVRLFSPAVWNGDEVLRRRRVAILKTFLPGTRVGVVVDDPRGHPRGAKVAFGGLFRDAVRRTTRHPTVRFGNHGVLRGRVVSFPFRRDRPFGLPLRGRVDEHRGGKPKPEQRTEPEWAAAAVRTVAKWLPGREILVVADRAAIGKTRRMDRPEDVDAIGPICRHAARTEAHASPDGRDGDSGKRSPSLRAIRADDRNGPPRTRRFTPPNGTRKRLPITWVEVGWATVAGGRRGAVVVVRDPNGQGRDEALVSPHPPLDDGEIVVGSCPRGRGEVAIGDATGQRGFHDPCGWKTASVPRAAPMAWFTGTSVMRWYARDGAKHPPAVRHRPWYPTTVTTFADLVSCCRLALWQQGRRGSGDRCSGHREPEVR